MFWGFFLHQNQLNQLTLVDYEQVVFNYLNMRLSELDHYKTKDLDMLCK